MIAKTERNKQADVVLAFWELAGEARWFTRNDAFDANVRQHFSEQHFAAARGEYADWMTRAEDALALLLLLQRIARGLGVTERGDQCHRACLLLQLLRMLEWQIEEQTQLR